MTSLPAANMVLNIEGKYRLAFMPTSFFLTGTLFVIERPMKNPFKPRMALIPSGSMALKPTIRQKKY